MTNILVKQGQIRLTPLFAWVAVIFCVCLITSNFLVPRLWKVWFLDIQLSGSFILFPISYIINDILTEVYGYRRARLVIWMGFTMCLFVSLMVELAVILPDPIDFKTKQLADSFNNMFIQVPRAMTGSLIAFIAGSSVNAWVMSTMKVATSGKGFGWRAIISTIAGETVDSIIFFPISLGGLIPFKELIALMIAQIIVKTIYEIICLPVTKIVVKKFKQIENLDTYDINISYNPFKITDL